MTNLNQINFPVVLAEFMTRHHLSARRIADAIACSEATLNRLLGGSTLATDEMLRQSMLLIELGFDRYSALTAAERDTLSETIGVIGGGVVGVGSVTAVVAASGSVAGLSAAGMTSGLAAMGAVIGGGMAAGIVVAAAMPIALAGVGYGIIRATKYFMSEWQLNEENFDAKWETPRQQA